MTYVTMQVGKRTFALESAILPPVGTIMGVHKHLTDDGGNAVVRVIGHEWSLGETSGEDNRDFGPGAELTVRIQTEYVRQ